MNKDNKQLLDMGIFVLSFSFIGTFVIMAFNNPDATFIALIILMLLTLSYGYKLKSRGTKK